MHVPALYLDTSVIGGYFDEEWCAPTQELWRQMTAGRFRFVTSEVTVNELAHSPERVRALFDTLFSRETILPLSEEVDELAAAYIRHGVLTENYINDATHVAACTVARIEYLVSWNFKHLVNAERKKGFSGVNLLQGYQPVSIVNPRELIYVSEDH